MKKKNKFYYNYNTISCGYTIWKKLWIPVLIFYHLLFQGLHDVLKVPRVYC